MKRDPHGGLPPSANATPAPVAAQVWPAGVALPMAMKLSGALDLHAGAIIPSMTKVELAGDAPVKLRPADASGRQGRNWALAAMLRSHGLTGTAALPITYGWMMGFPPGWLARALRSAAAKGRLRPV